MDRPALFQSWRAGSSRRAMEELRVIQAQSGGSAQDCYTEPDRANISFPPGLSSVQSSMVLSFVIHSLTLSDI
jgi:hypothetical protein